MEPGREGTAYAQPANEVEQNLSMQGPWKTQDQRGGQMMVLKNIGIWWRGDTHSRCTKKPNDRIRSANRLRILARGYKALKKDKAAAFEAAAEALEFVERRSGK